MDERIQLIGGLKELEIHLSSGLFYGEFFDLPKRCIHI